MSTVEQDPRQPRLGKLLAGFQDIWNASGFSTEDLAMYASRLALTDTRSGLIALSLLTLCLFGLDVFLFDQFGFFAEASYTCSLLALLSVHILLFSRSVNDTRSLYLLGATLLLVSGTGFVLLANTVGDYNFALFSSVTLLIIVIPIVPWGLREGFMVLALIYVMFTIATWADGNTLDHQTRWSLQFIMLGAGTVSLAIVARSTAVRKADIRTRYELEQAKHYMTKLSNKDPLTEAWNRRFLTDRFVETVRQWDAENTAYHFAFIDIDDFKRINDTYGHDFGDTVLRCTSDALRHVTEGQGHVVRMGGDEFALLFSSENPETQIAEGLAEFQQRMGAERSNTHRVKYSVGMVSVAPGTAVTQEQVYKAADQALYEAKARKSWFAAELNLVRTEVGSSADRASS